MTARAHPAPRLTPKVRCQALDMDGNQCRKAAVAEEDYHGDSELYGGFNKRPKWVRVNFCEGHLKP